MEEKLSRLPGSISNIRDVEMERDVRKQQNFLVKQEQILWAQRAEYLWVVDGDKNTKYFHTIVYNRRK